MVVVAVVFGTLGSLVLVLVIVIVMFYVAKRLRKASPRELEASVVAKPENETDVAQADALTMDWFLQDVGKQEPLSFTAQQLCKFTSNYSTKLGSGGFGVVYKGQLPNGVKIAVKVLNSISDKNADEQFMEEVSTISKTHHPNLVRLYGFCYDPFVNALVYEYMDNGSLDKYLFIHDKQPIEGEELLGIAIGTAKGIAYLHEECHPRIIHYDIKPGNILLDGNLCPKVADFGLAKLCNKDNTHISVTGYRGTPGYSAPEFLLKNHPISNKCDVYSFGMVLFEMVRRRRNTSYGSSEGLDDWFPKHVSDLYQKGELETMGVACGCEIQEKDREKAERMCKVALWCVQDSPDSRPTMSVVVKMLEGVVEILPPPKPFEYLYSTETDTSKPSESGYGSSYTTSNETSSFWYKETPSLVTSI